MSVGLKLAGFAAALALLFGVGTAAGKLIDAERPGGGEAADDTHGGDAGMDEMAAMDAVRGLAVAENGFRLELADADLPLGERRTLNFRIVGGDDEPVTEFDVEHTKRMHLIVVRRDLTGFQHLHPRMAADGTWSVPLKLTEPGSYRAFADFSSGGTITTLAGDLRVDGDAELVPLPAADVTSASAGGYRVGLRAGELTAGEEAELAFEVTRRGAPVRIDPYLGANGHLVALREGDLAFLHVHPVEDPEASERSSVAFEATFPTPGRYRLFLQFKVDGYIETVAFTREVR